MKTSPTIGRIVRYVLPHGHNRAGQVVPAIITRVWDEQLVQLTPFVDVANDQPIEAGACSSVPYDEAAKPRTWHWPSRD
jgi:hypothetical protein